MPRTLLSDDEQAGGGKPPARIVQDRGCSVKRIAITNGEGGEGFDGGVGLVCQLWVLVVRVPTSLQ